MFANLKNKLIEEVKASPSKFQQFANAAQAAVSSSSSTPSGSESVSGNENFFSITEEDTPQNSPNKPLKLPYGTARAKGPNISPQSNNGAIPRTRKLSNSSVASDVSFRLPSYESPAVYHLQSDLDVSASEVEDSGPTARLDLINKEQLKDAYKKALDRCHKYRLRYTDLAKKYKDLERDSTHARSVLVETQEKAIRRISELREQCSLEQQAKAHLEEALRVEMDDMQCKMQAYQTKLTLLGENPENILALSKTEPLIQLNSSSNSTTSTIDPNILINLDVENNHIAATDDKVTTLMSQLAKQETEIIELNKRLQEATSTIDSLKKQEEENAISLAQTKQAIYSELESKESLVNRLKTDLNEAEGKYQHTSKENNQLSLQIADTAELKEKLKILKAAKQEAEAKVISSTHMESEAKQQLASKEKVITALEDRLQNLSKEHEERLKDLRQQNEELSGMIRQYQTSEIALAEIDNELNRTKTENNGLRETIEEIQRRLVETQSEIDGKQKQLDEMQREKENLSGLHEESKRQFEELSKEFVQVRIEKDGNETRVKQLESEMKVLNEQSENSESETIVALKGALHKATSEMNEQLKEAKEALSAKEKELKSLTSKFAKTKKQLEAQEANFKEIDSLRQSITEYEINLSRMQLDHQQQEEQTEREKSELKAQVANILQEIGTMEEEIRVVRASHSDLEAEKRSLEQKIENMKKTSQDANDGTQRWKDQLTEAQEKLKVVEQKLQSVESENSQLAEKNCLLEESSNRLEKLIAEHERQRNETEIQLTNLKQQCETADGNIQKLNEKMAQVLDENSRLHNAKELMEHEYRSLQDQCESKEKEKLCVLDSNKCLEDEMKAFKEEIDSLTRENNNLSEMSNNLRSDLSDALENVRVEEEKNEKMSVELKTLINARVHLEEELKVVREEAVSLKNDRSVSGALEDNKRMIDGLQTQLSEAENNIKIAENRVTEYNQQIDELTKKLVESEANMKSSEDRITESHLKIEGLSNQLAAVEEELKSSQEQVGELNLKLEASTIDMKCLENSNAELSTLREKLHELEQQLEDATSQIRTAEERHEHVLSEQLALKESQLSTLTVDLKTAQENISKLTETNKLLQNEIDTLENNNQSRLAELESRLQQTSSENQNLQETARNATDLEKKLQNYEQLQLENEYMNTLNQQLQADIRKQSEDRANVALEIAALKEKINSQRCELYVLNENQEKHADELAGKCKEILKTQEGLSELQDSLEKERAELTRQTDHANFITEQNDKIQKELLACQQQLAEAEKELREVKTSCEEVTAEKLKLIDQLASAEGSSKQQIDSLRSEIDRSSSTLETLNKEVDDLNKEIEKVDAIKEEKNELLKQIEVLKVELAERVQPLKVETATESAKATQQESENLRKINDQLQRELEDLQYKSRAEIANLTEEIDDLLTNAKHMSEKLNERQTTPESPPTSADATQIQQEKDELESKLKTIMHDVQDVSNRNLFLEQKCENYLILEQSNERLKSQNEKLSRQLDETLISMQHNEGITANTEFEYLKNIMFQYLTGTMNGNNETLVKVISAVLKFSPQQTQVALEKEHQRRSLLGQFL